MQVTYIYIKVISANGNNKIRKDIISEKIKKKKKEGKKGKKGKGKEERKRKEKAPQLIHYSLTCSAGCSLLAVFSVKSSIFYF